MFAAEYEFRSIQSKSTTSSPDGKYRVQLEVIYCKSLFRQSHSVEAAVFRTGSNKRVSWCEHLVGPPYSISSKPPVFAKNDPRIRWEITKLHNLTYPVTDKEEVTLSLGAQEFVYPKPKWISD